LNKSRKQFSFTKRVLNGLNELVTEAIGNLGIIQSSEKIMQRLIDVGIVEGYYDYLEWIKKKRHK